MLFLAWLLICIVGHRSVAEATAESFHTATGIQNLLFTGIKRMASRTDIEMDVFAEGRTRFNDVATATGGFDIVVRWMEVCFHLSCTVLFAQSHAIQVNRALPRAAEFSHLFARRQGSNRCLQFPTAYAFSYLRGKSAT